MQPPTPTNYAALEQRRSTLTTRRTAHVGREVKYPSLGWEILESDARLKCPTFTMTTVDGYFVERKDEDGLPSENYKSLVGATRHAASPGKAMSKTLRSPPVGQKFFLSPMHPRNEKRQA